MMPRKKNKHIRSGCYEPSNILTTLGDLTINDVANSAVQRRGLKKLTSKDALNKVLRERRWRKGQGGQQLQEEEEEEEEEEGEEEENGNTAVTGTKRKRRRKRDSCSDDVEMGWLELPLDVWAIISECIRPEDVGKFAAICRATTSIVATGKFWYSLYKRFCYHTFHLPKDLSWWELRSSGIAGLRGRVVRALFLTYSPLMRTLAVATAAQRTLFTNRASMDTDRLLHTQCVLFWHMRRGNRHHYVFKMFDRGRIAGQALTGRMLSATNTASHLKLQPRVCQHPEDACYLLQIVCSSICEVGSDVMGQYLSLVCVSPAEVTMYNMQKLSLTFTGAPHSPPHHRGYGSSGGGNANWHNAYRSIGWNTIVKVVLQPVEWFRVLPWWDPHYTTVSNLSNGGGSGGCGGGEGKEEKNEADESGDMW